MDGDGRGAPVRVTERNVAAPLAHDHEALAFKNREQSLARYRGETYHVDLHGNVNVLDRNGSRQRNGIAVVTHHFKVQLCCFLDVGKSFGMGRAM